MFNKDSKLLQEYLSITGAEPNLDRGTYVYLVLKTPKDTFYIDRVVSVDILSDFVHNFTDRVTVTAQLPKGDFLKQVLPENNNLTCTLRINVPGKILTGNFRVKIDIKEWENVELNSNQTHEKLNYDIINFTFEVTNRDIIEFRNKRVSGSFKDSTVTDVLISLLDVFKIEKVDGIKKPSYLDKFIEGNVVVVKPNNTRKYKHIIIKDIKLMGLPFYLQEKYGVYNGHINLYRKIFDNSKLYIFPTFRVDMFKDTNMTLKIIAIDDNSAKGHEVTYAVDGNVVKILVFRGQKHKNDERELKNRGVKVKTIDSNTILTRPYQISNESLKVSSKYTTVKTQHKKIKDGDSPIVNGGITNNHYKIRSKVLEHDGFYVRLEWFNSNYFLLQPMMDVIYVEEVNEEIHTYRGLLHNVNTIIDNTTHTSISVLDVFLKYEERPAKPIIEKIF